MQDETVNETKAKELMNLKYDLVPTIRLVLHSCDIDDIEVFSTKRKNHENRVCLRYVSESLVIMF